LSSSKLSKLTFAYLSPVIKDLGDSTPCVCRAILNITGFSIWIQVKNSCGRQVPGFIGCTAGNTKCPGQSKTFDGLV